MSATRFALVAAACLLADPVIAEEASQAQSWGLSEERLAVLAGTVVDVRCELAGDCPPGCGGGGRQLGLLTDAGKLVLVAKNGQPLFNGAVPDLLPFCNQAVEVDGLMTGHGGVEFYQVQLIRPAGESDWEKANRWTEAWAAANPDIADGEGPWFRRDPRVTQRIQQNGYLGLGLEADQVFIDDWF